MHRQIYYEALDLTITSITDRFDQADYKINIQCEELLLKTARSEDCQSEFECVTSFYSSDFTPARLHTHLKSFSSNFMCDGVLATTTLKVYFDVSTVTDIWSTITNIFCCYFGKVDYCNACHQCQQ